MSKRKAPSEDNLNHDFCEFLSELAEYEKNVNRNIHKYNAYRKASSVLAAHPTRIKSGEEAIKLNGVGSKIAKKIEEFLETGKLAKLEKIHDDVSSTAISLLTRVSGIGPAKARELVNQGITNLEELKSNNEKLNHHQKIGLRYFDDFEKPIPRSEIQNIEAKLKKNILQLDPTFTVTICGSYRRGKATSGDIDVLITHPSYTSTSDTPKSKKGLLLKSIVTALENESIVTNTLSLGDTKFMGVCKFSNESASRRLDIRFTPFDQYYCATLYFTGSDVFNKTMRAHALEKRFTLNEYCLRPIGCTGVPGEAVEITSEEDVFDYIDFNYKTPKERNM